jgi:hypothetical protein
MWGIAGVNPWFMAALAGLGILLILLLVLWLIKPVRIDYYVEDETKKAICIRKRFAKAPKRGRQLTLDVTDKRIAARTYFIKVTFGRGFTKKMRARSACVVWQKRAATEYNRQEPKGPLVCYN